MKLTEKYRPKTLDEVVGQEEAVNELKGLIKLEREQHIPIPDFLFYGPAGVGKTTIAYCLAHELNISDIVEFNASKDRGINFVRDFIITLAQSRGINSTRKIIFLDEADKLTEEAQTALRRAMEQYSQSSIFIFSVNDKSQMIAPIINRCYEIEFKRIKEEDLKKFAQRILQGENLTLSDSVLNNVVKYSYGSARKLVLLLMKAIVGGSIEENSIDYEKYLNIIKTGVDKQKALIDAVNFLGDKPYREFVHEFLDYYTQHYKNVNIVKSIGQTILSAPEPDNYVGKVTATAFLILKRDEL